jgi:hypothetical protein
MDGLGTGEIRKGLIKLFGKYYLLFYFLEKILYCYGLDMIYVVSPWVHVLVFNPDYQVLKGTMMFSL